MQWLQNLDVSVFRFLNGKLVNPLLDQVMPFVSGNVFFFPALIILAAFVIWKYRGRGMIFLLLLALAVGLSDGAICRTIKHAVGRDRPFAVLPDVRCLLGQGGSGSMPSSHAANWFAATMVAFVFYRRSLWILLPLATAVSFSRVYCGVHYPSDVIAGAILGTGTAAATLWLCTELWIFIGRRWFPLWWEKFPLLIAPPKPGAPESEDSEEPQFAPRLKARQKPAPETFAPRHVTVDQQWLRLGYLVIGVLLIARLVYIASDVIQLSPEEAAQWLRSRQWTNLEAASSPVAFSLIWAGTRLFGDTQFAVRVFAPVLAAVLGVMLIRFFGRSVNARAGFFLILFLAATPMLAAGSILLQGDFLRAFFWTAGFMCGWRALQTEKSAGFWILTGLFAAFVSLSELATLFPLACFLFLFVLSPIARRQLKTPGPWIALVLCAAPIATSVLWPAKSHDRLAAPWTHASSILFLNPIWLLFAGWAAIAFWRRNRHNPLLVYCFCMSVPALAFAFAFDRGWGRMAAPAVTLLCLLIAYWDIQWRLRSAQLKPWLATCLLLSLVLTLLGHETNWVEKLAGRPLPVKLDPLASVRCWRETALAADKVRLELATEGKPLFAITDTTGLAGELSFYLHDPAAVYAYAESGSDSEDRRFNYFGRRGENAIFIHEVAERRDSEIPFEARLQTQFESTTDLGIREIKYHGQVLRRFQFFACRNLK